MKHMILSTLRLWAGCCPQEIKKQFREMKGVKQADTETKGCASTSKSVTASCAWDFQPLRVGGKPPDNFQRISTEFLQNSEDIYITRSTPLISSAKTEQHSVVSCFKRVILYHILKNTIKCFSRRRSNSLSRMERLRYFYSERSNFLVLTHLIDDQLSLLSFLSELEGRKSANKI